MGVDNQTIKDLLQQFVEQSGKKQVFDEQRVLTLWAEKMPASITAQTRCISIQQGVLKLKTTNAALRFQLMATKSELMEQLNSWVGAPVVKDIIFS